MVGADTHSNAAAAYNKDTMIGFSLVGASSVFLLFGITCQMIQYDYVLDVAGFHLHIMEGSRSMIGPGERNESSICRFLYDQKNYMTLSLIFLFGVAIPVFKMMLFFMALVYRYLGQADYANMVRYGQCMKVAAKLSKWAAADAMAEAIIVAMFLKVDHARASHRVGYFCFVLYCVMSTLAYAFVLPSKRGAAIDGGDIQIPVWTPLVKKCKETTAHALRNPNVRVGTVLITLSCFLVCLGLGAGLETVHIWMPRKQVENQVMQQLQKVPAMQPFIATQGITALQSYLSGLVSLNTNISMAGSIYRLMHSNHMYTVSGSFMLFFCAFFLPVWDAILSTALALTSAFQNNGEKKDDGGLAPIMETSPMHAAFSSFDRMRQLSRHLAMLDVLLVGLCLGLLVASTEEELRCSVLPSSTLLVLSVFFWYLHSFICDATLAGQDEDEEDDEEEEEEEAPETHAARSSSLPPQEDTPSSAEQA